MFFDTDVDSTVDGDLVVSNGDFSAATVSDTLLRTISFCLLTEYCYWSKRSRSDI